MKVKDLLKYLTFLIVLTASIPLLKFVNPIFPFFTLISFIISLKFEFEKRIFLNTIGIAIIIFTILRISEKNLIVPIVEAIFVLIAIKFLEKKKYRDYMQIYLLTLFIASAYTLLTLKIYFIAYITVLLIFFTIAGIILTFFDNNEDIILTKDALGKIILNSLLIFILSLPIAIVIFIILPRVKSPLFDFLNQEKIALSGFSDRLTLGDVKEIKLDNSIIFRVSMKKIKKNNLYWRGIVFDYFDGKTWKYSGNIKENIRDVKIKGNLIKQTFYLEPYYGKYLFALDKPIYLIKKNIDFNGLIFIKSKKILTKRIKYSVFSIISDSAIIKNISREKYLQIPKDLSIKITSLAKKLKSNTPENTLERIIKFYKNQHLKYEIKNLPITKHPLEDFLFKYKYGNCEYFASSFAILLRLCGIPARLVAGYKGGMYSNLGNYYIVRQKDAHVWVEAYINNLWLRLDPVIFITLNNLVNSKNNKSKLEKNAEPLTLKIKLFVDLINYYWIKFVINYNFNKQIKLFLNISQINLRKILFNFIIFLLPLFIFFLPFYIIKFYKSKEERLIKYFHDKIKKFVDYDKLKDKTMREILTNINEKHAKKIVEEFVENFEKNYFKDKKITSTEYYRLKKILNKLDKLKQ